MRRNCKPKRCANKRKQRKKLSCAVEPLRRAMCRVERLPYLSTLWMCAIGAIERLKPQNNNFPAAINNTTPKE
jgi:hypothetical protein